MKKKKELMGYYDSPVYIYFPDYSFYLGCLLG